MKYTWGEEEGLRFALKVLFFLKRTKLHLLSPPSPHQPHLPTPPHHASQCFITKTAPGVVSGAGVEREKIEERRHNYSDKVLAGWLAGC